MYLPRCAEVLSESVNAKEFFENLSKLKVNKEDEFRDFLHRYQRTRFRVSGLSDNISITERDKDSPVFEEFNLDLWKQYYIQEDVKQVAILEDKSPVEVRIFSSNYKFKYRPRSRPSQ